MSSLVPTHSTMRIRLLAAAVTFAVSACSTDPLRDQVLAESTTMRQSSKQAPAKTVTSFTDGLRCMDNLMLLHGVKGIPVLVEDIADSTRKVNAGAKDMLISAISEMTRRSDGVRLIAYGPDASNLTNMMASTLLSPGSGVLSFSLKPSYAIRGSITQLDENLVRDRNQGGIQFGPVGAGAAESASSSLLGLDLNVISAADFTAVSGVSASNSLIILKQGKGFDADLLYKKFGVNFEMNLERSEGQAQALRTLIQLAAIELIGKLTKVPYWRCVGLDLSNAAVLQEARDWHYNLVRRGEIVPYVQRQLRQRGWYDGPLMREPTPEFEQALTRAASALGVPGARPTDERLFFALLSNDLVAPNLATRPTDEMVGVRITATNGSRQFARGESVHLTVTVDRSAYVYCYMQDEAGRLIRIHPNRHHPRSSIQPAAPLQIPGNLPYAIRASEFGKKEAVACFATERDVSDSLGTMAWGVDLETLPTNSIKDVQQAFATIGGGQVGSDAFLIDVR